MTQQHHLNHATWDCEYHVVFIPKYQKKAVFGKIKKNLGVVFHDLARRRECRIEEGHLMPDHVHMLVSIPPKYSVAEVIGFRRAKARFGSRRISSERRRTSPGTSSGRADISSRRWARDEETIRVYIRNQELQDRKMDQFALIP